MPLLRELHVHVEKRTFKYYEEKPLSMHVKAIGPKRYYVPREDSLPHRTVVKSTICLYAIKAVSTVLNAPQNDS